MNHHHMALPAQEPVSGRQTLIQAVAAAVRALIGRAEQGATQREMFDAAALAGADCARMAGAVGEAHAPGEVVAILRRLLRKEARRRWEDSGEADRAGQGEAALRDRKVSILLDAAADALGAPFPSPPPIAPSRQGFRQSPLARCAGVKATLAS